MTRKFSTRAIHAGEGWDRRFRRAQHADLPDGDVLVRESGGDGRGGHEPARQLLLFAHRQPDDGGARSEDGIARRVRSPRLVTSSGMAAVAISILISAKGRRSRGCDERPLRYQSTVFRGRLSGDGYRSNYGRRSRYPMKCGAAIKPNTKALVCRNRYEPEHLHLGYAGVPED